MSILPDQKKRPGTKTTDEVNCSPQHSNRKKIPGRRSILGLIGTMALVLILEFFSRSGLADRTFLPPFSSVFTTLFVLFGDPRFLWDIGSTLVTWLFGLTLSVILAVPIGLLLGLSPKAYKLAWTPMELVRTLPAVALIPLVIVMAGNGLEMKLIIAVYAGLWPILFNTIYGTRGTDPKAKEMARSFKLGGGSILRRIVLPSAAPFVATGIRVSSSIVLIVAITVELLAGGSSGIGAFMSAMRVQGNRIEEVYAAILVAGLLGLLINAALSGLERRYFQWETTTRSGS